MDMSFFRVGTVMFFLMVSVSGRELWQSYKFDMLATGNENRNEEFADSSFFLLIAGDFIMTFEKQNECYLDSVYPVDRVENDSLFCPGFTFDFSTDTYEKITRLYYTDDELVYLEKSTYFVESSTESAKIYFFKTDTALEALLIENSCSPDPVKNHAIKRIAPRREETGIYNLLGQKLDAGSILRSSKWRRFISR